MKKKIHQWLEKYPYLKYLGNRYIWVLIFFGIWLFFLDNYSYFEHRILNKEIKELEENKSYYQKEIESDCLEIKRLKNPEYIEKYAREKYYMKKDSEDIYIIEFEEGALDNK